MASQRDTRLSLGLGSGKVSSFFIIYYFTFCINSSLFFVETQLSDVRGWQRSIFAPANAARRLHRVFKQEREYHWIMFYVLLRIKLDLLVERGAELLESMSR